jgi:flagellar basal-body rod protein FlgB
MTLFTDGVQSALERAMDGVSLRQRVTSQNIANAMTPGYQASKVDFEGALSDALANGQSADSVSATVTPTGRASTEDGNNVDLETETAGLMKSDLQYQALVQATNYKLSILRAAVR